MRLIDADEVLSLFGMNEDCDKCTEDKRSCRNDILYKKSNFCDLINYIPTVEPERKKDDWTSCSKELPEELIAVNVTWVNHNPELYYKEIKDKRFVDTAVYCQGDWYWWDCRCVDYLSEYGNRAPVEMVDSNVEIIAWKPLPEPYRGEKE